MSGTPAIEFEGRRFGVQRIEGEEAGEAREGGREEEAALIRMDRLWVVEFAPSPMLPSQVSTPLVRLHAGTDP